MNFDFLFVGITLAVFASAQRYPPPRGGRRPPPHPRGGRPPPPRRGGRGYYPGQGGKGGGREFGRGFENGGGSSFNGDRNNFNGGNGGFSGPRSFRGNGGGRGNNVDTKVRDGPGCRGQGGRRQPSTMFLENDADMDAFEDALRRTIESGRCRSGGHPRMGGSRGGNRRNFNNRGKRQAGFGQCRANGGVCDSGNTRTESFFYENESFFVNGEERHLIVTNGIPDHCYHEEQDHAPNGACEHYAAMTLPYNFRAPNYRQDRFRKHPMGPVGIAVSGAFFYNHQSGFPNCNAAAIMEADTFDSCDGHADPECRYHYHKAPVCIPGFRDCALMGFMADGVPVYGKCRLRTRDGRTLEMTSNYQLRSGSGCDISHYSFDFNNGGILDEANGFIFDQEMTSEDGATVFEVGQYAYFFTPEFPFIMPGTYLPNSGVCLFDPTTI